MENLLHGVILPSCRQDAYQARPVIWAHRPGSSPFD